MKGWLYWAGVKKLFNGKLLGCAMSERMTKLLAEVGSVFIRMNTVRCSRSLA